MQEIFVKTEKAFIADLPRFVFEGKVEVAQSARETESALRYLRGAGPLVGIDTETRPSFHKGETHKVALMQVSTDEVCILFRLCMTGLTPGLIDLLEDGNIIKIGLSLKDDLLMLRRRHNFTPRGFLDLQTYAAEMGIRDMSLQKLYANLFHKKITKRSRLTNWERDVLTEEQKRYAATDAYTCLQMYRRLEELRRTGQYVLVESEPETPADSAGA